MADKIQVNQAEKKKLYYLFYNPESKHWKECHNPAEKIGYVRLIGGGREKVIYRARENEDGTYFESYNYDGGILQDEDLQGLYLLEEVPANKLPQRTVNVSENRITRRSIMVEGLKAGLSEAEIIKNVLEVFTENTEESIAMQLKITRYSLKKQGIEVATPVTAKKPKEKITSQEGTEVKEVAPKKPREPRGISRQSIIVAGITAGKDDATILAEVAQALPEAPADAVARQIKINRYMLKKKGV